MSTICTLYSLAAECGVAQTATVSVSYVGSGEVPEFIGDPSTNGFCMYQIHEHECGGVPVRYNGTRLVKLLC